MRVPLSWLRELVDVDLSPEELAEKLTLLGMEVSSIEHIGADWHNIVVGELIEVAPHPNSRKLSLTRVRTGVGDEELSVVCGATNIKAGQRIPVARPGSVLPGQRAIDITTIAGTESQGMLCSGDELGLTADADGILILPPDSELGLDLARMAGDVVLDVDVKPNRGDALSILGLAREVAAATGATLRWPDLSVEESGDDTADHVTVDIDDAELCPVFVGRYVEGVKVGPSPWDVQKRLIAAGVRPVSNIVDASNYVLMELGKPIHTFDGDKVDGGRITVRTAREGETLETLDHVERKLTTDTLLITDDRGPLAIAGVMGGAESEVTDETTNIIIESAIFDPVSIRRTAFRYALRSEASQRFEKGQEHRMARLGADRTAALIARWGGGRVATGVIDTQPEPPAQLRVAFRPRRVSQLLGAEIAVAEQRDLLARVEIETEAAGPDEVVTVIAGKEPLTVAADPSEALVARIPGHRRDITIEADLIEEIARVRGYETLDGRLPDTGMPEYRPDPQRLTDRLRAYLSGSGLNELTTHGLIGPDDHARLGIGPDDPGTIRASNPVTVDHSELRRSMIPEHLRVLVENERQKSPDLHAFELGAIHAWQDGQPTQTEVLGLILAGRDRPVGLDREVGDVDVSLLKGFLERLTARLTWNRLTYERLTPRPGVEHPGRTAAVVAVSPTGDSTIVGRVGELHPSLLQAHGVNAARVIFAEIYVEAFDRLAPDRLRVGRLEHLPGVERDIAVVVPEDTGAGQVEAVIRESGGSNLRAVTLFDQYRGAPLETHEKSLAYRLRFEFVDDSADEEAVDPAVEQVVAVLSERLGARLRS